jgi:hypothetical protein
MITPVRKPLTESVGWGARDDHLHTVAPTVALIDHDKTPCVAENVVICVRVVFRVVYDLGLLEAYRFKDLLHHVNSFRPHKLGMLHLLLLFGISKPTPSGILTSIRNY